MWVRGPQGFFKRNRYYLLPSTIANILHLLGSFNKTDEGRTSGQEGRMLDCQRRRPSRRWPHVDHGPSTTKTYLQQGRQVRRPAASMPTSLRIDKWALCHGL
ncbi:hypothetical protein RvY_18925 [Ramazzottius varieornatus]|uniref:Uncharacterized protein n=1 Tax=Ramazzottius varieornatus TaxID=947166 RepID=A0A1D1W7L7_RAMVA|nr:hypothetical protein RvY_18925 [Ramazzottius varieornatus]